MSIIYKNGLKLCPFCGSAAKTTKLDSAKWAVVCENSGCNANLGVDLTREMAEKKWNRRQQ